MMEQKLEYIHNSTSHARTPAGAGRLAPEGEILSNSPRCLVFLLKGLYSVRADYHYRLLFSIENDVLKVSEVITIEGINESLSIKFIMGHDRIIDKKGNEIHLDVELHPGEVLADELEARKLTKSAFAMKIGMYPSHFGDIVNCKRNITANVALKLETALGISAEFWMGLQMDYDLHVERNKLRQTA